MGNLCFCAAGDETMGTTSSKKKGPSVSSSLPSFSPFAPAKGQPRTTLRVAKEKIETATKTGVLSLTGHKLKEVPEDVWGIEKLTTLDLTQNQLAKIDGVERLVNLKVRCVLLPRPILPRGRRVMLF